MAAVQASPEEHEVVVIGSGAGGGTVAHVLTGLGLRVTLLEAGPMLDPYQEFKEHQWPYDVEHRGAEAGGKRYFARGKPFGYFATTSAHHEHATVARLAELIVPADGGGGSAIDAGAPEFIDLLCSQNLELAEIYRGGLAWIDATMRRRSGSTFVDSTPSEQTALLDALVDAEQRGDVAALGPGVEFFGWVRRMTVDAYYTSPIGIADLGYAGNASTARYEVPQNALDFVNRRIDEL